MGRWINLMVVNNIPLYFCFTISVLQASCCSDDYSINAMNKMAEERGKMNYVESQQ